MFAGRYLVALKEQSDKILQQTIFAILVKSLFVGSKTFLFEYYDKIEIKYYYTKRVYPAN